MGGRGANSGLRGGPGTGTGGGSGSNGGGGSGGGGGGTAGGGGIRGRSTGAHSALFSAPGGYSGQMPAGGQGGTAQQPMQQGRFDRQNGPLTQGYKQKLEQMFDNGTEDAKNAYDKYIPKGGAVIDGNSNNAYYRPLNNAVYMSFAADEYNVRGAGSTWFHEHGHYLDHNAGNPSQNTGFWTCIQNDVKNYEDNWLARNGLKRGDITDQELRHRIGREIVRKGASATHAIQDIYGGVYVDYNGHTAGSTIIWGHSWNDYWIKNGQSRFVPKEAWAHMFNASFSSNKQDAMREYLPSAWEWFNNRIKGL